MSLGGQARSTADAWRRQRGEGVVPDAAVLPDSLTIETSYDVPMSRIGLLLVDHGSRRAASNAQLDDMADRVARLRPDAPVAAAHLEIAEPTIEAGIDDLVRRGAREILVLLYFLSDGRHSQEDVPRLVQGAVARHPGVTARVGQALGPHDALAALLLERAGA